MTLAACPGWCSREGHANHYIMYVALMSPICARRLLPIEVRYNATETSLGILQAGRKFIGGLKELPPVGLQCQWDLSRCQICSDLAKAPPKRAADIATHQAYQARFLVC
jgi:hypothetical protein